MAKGIWIHHDRQLRYDGSRSKRAYRHATGRCGHANLYWGYKDNVTQVDARCARCGVRVRFNLRRKIADERGSKTQVIWMPSRLPRSELLAKVRAMNGVDDFDTTEGFSTALELMKKNSQQNRGGK